LALATTEGTLVASYSRGMGVLNAAGGVKVTVLERYMQRAPVFHFDNAREARDAGQNMSGKAAQAACQWIMKHYGKKTRYTLSGAIDTDKKHSHLNTLHSRGARVVAEITLPADVVKQKLRVDTKDMYRARQVSTLGGLLAGTTNNGLHAANALAALFIATGQDAANVSESQAGLTYVELNDDGSLYWSITLPSLIVATYGGGTGLATQRECLEILDCYGNGKALKFAEICAATVLAGELSLAILFLYRSAGSIPAARTTSNYCLSYHEPLGVRLTASTNIVVRIYHPAKTTPDKVPKSLCFHIEAF